MAGPAHLAPAHVVRIRGLVAATQHNGRTGCAGTFDATAGRYVVALDPSPDGLTSPTDRIHRTPPDAVSSTSPPAKI